MSGVYDNPRYYSDDIDDLIFDVDPGEVIAIESGYNERPTGYSLMATQFLMVGTTRVSIDVQMIFEDNIAKLSQLSEIDLEICYILDPNSNAHGTHDANVLYNGSGNELNAAEQEWLRQEIEQELDEYARYNNAYFKTFVITPTVSEKSKKCKRYTLITEHIAVEVKIKQDDFSSLPSVKLIVYDLEVHGDPAIVYRAASLISGGIQNTGQPTNVFPPPTWNEVREVLPETGGTDFVDEITRMTFEDYLDEFFTDPNETLQNDDNNVELLYYRLTEPNNADVPSADELFGVSSSDEYNIPDISESPASSSARNDDNAIVIDAFMGNVCGSDFVLNVSDNSSLILDDIEAILDLSGEHILEENNDIYDNSDGNILYTDENSYQSTDVNIADGISVVTPLLIEDVSALAIQESIDDVGGYNYFEDEYETPSRADNVNESTNVSRLCSNFQDSLNFDDQAADNIWEENNIPEPITGLPETNGGLIDSIAEHEDSINMCNDVCTLSLNQNTSTGDLNEDVQVSDEESKRT